MRKLVRRAAMCGAVGLGMVLAPTAVASAEVTVPFQISPAPYGNPNGSVDSPPAHCVAVVGEVPGTVRISDAEGFNTGCYLVSDVRWVNLTTGASGAARMSDGLGGTPREAVIRTGPGQVALVGLPSNGFTLPGLATFYVP